MTECDAGCGTALHPAAAAGGFTRHPGCEPAEPTTEWRWACSDCPATGRAAGAEDARSRLARHGQEHTRMRR